MSNHMLLRNLLVIHRWRLLYENPTVFLKRYRCRNNHEPCRGNSGNDITLCELNSLHYVCVIIMYNSNNLGRRGVFIKCFIHY